MTNIGRYLWISALVLAVMITGATVYKVKQSEVDKITLNLRVCYDANAGSHAAIQMLKADIRQADDICDVLLRSKERSLAELKRIDALKPSPSRRGQGEDGSSPRLPVAVPSPSLIPEGGPHAPTDTDPVLAELNSMFNSAAR